MKKGQIWEQNYLKLLDKTVNFKALNVNEVKLFIRKVHKSFQPLSSTDCDFWSRLLGGKINKEQVHKNMFGIWHWNQASWLEKIKRRYEVI